MASLLKRNADLFESLRYLMECDKNMFMMEYLARSTGKIFKYWHCDDSIVVNSLEEVYEDVEDFLETRYGNSTNYWNLVQYDKKTTIMILEKYPCIDNLPSHMEMMFELIGDELEI